MRSLFKVISLEMYFSNSTRAVLHTKGSPFLCCEKRMGYKSRGNLNNDMTSQLKIFGKGSGEEPFYKKVFPSRRRQKRKEQKNAQITPQKTGADNPRFCVPVHARIDGCYLKAVS